MLINFSLVKIYIKSSLAFMIKKKYIYLSSQNPFDDAG